MVQIHPSLPFYIHRGSYLSLSELILMRGKFIAILMACSFLFSGCLGADEESSLIQISVNMEGASGTVHFVKDANNGTSIEGMQVSFDFTGTESSGGALTEFWLEPGDGTQRMSTNAAESKILSRDYVSYGIFQSRAGANDSGGNSASEELTISFNGAFHLNQTSPTGVDEPADLHIDSMNINSVQSPVKMEISSTITNVENALAIPPPDDVEITWQLFDPSGELIATHTQVIGEGQSYTWTHNEEIPMIGGWELIIGDAVDNENVNQETTALVLF